MTDQPSSPNHEAQPAVVVVNGEERTVPSGLSVLEFLKHFDLHPGMVVVELNRTILERDSYGSHYVASGDQIELVHFVGGG